MKVIPFNVPKTTQEAFRLQVDMLPHLYDKLHQHPETQIMLIEKGEGTLIAGDYVGRFAASDIFLIGGGQSHVFRNDEKYYRSHGRKNVQATSIYFDEKYAGESFWQLDELQEVKKFLARAGAGIRIARIHHQRAHRPGERQVLLANDHGRGTEAVLREHAGDARAFGKPHDQQVLALCLAHAGLGDAQHYAPHRQQIFRFWRS